MLPSDLSVQVRDITLARQGVIKPSDLDLAATLIVRDVGSWRLTLPKDHPMVPVLATPGSGIIVDHRPSGNRLFSGPTEVPSNLQNSANPDGTYTFTGLTDTVILRDALAFPSPAIADPNAQTQANDDRTATHAETLMRGYVSDNIGPTAPAGRRGLLAQHLTIAANGNRGAAAQASPRFTNLLELEQDLGLFAGLGFQVIQRAGALVFEVLALTDRSGLILLDINSGTISSQQATVSPPTITRAIVAGGGEGIDRVMVQRTTADSTTAEGDWGRVIEEFIDQRQTTDLGELGQKGDAELAASGYTAIAIKIVASDDVTMIYGTDWREGDVVRINYNGEPRTTLVTAAAIIANSKRTVIGMSIGDTSHMTPAGRTAAATNSNTSDVKALQANAEATPLTWGGLTGIPTALTADAGQDAIVFWDDSANALGQATLAATLVMTGTVLSARAATSAVTGVVQLATDAEAITGTDATKAVTPHSLSPAVLAILATLPRQVSKIINGDGRINQRAAASAASLASGAYFLDRWKSGTASNAVTWTGSDIAGRVLTVPASKSIQQDMEQTDIPAGDYTLVWTGTAQARVYNVGSTPPSYAAGPLTVTLDGSANVRVEFGPGTVSKVAMWAGRIAFPFVTPELGAELRRCLRYFEAFAAGDVSISNPYWNVALGGGDQQVMRGTIVPMRVAPTPTNPAGLTTVLFTYRSYTAGTSTNRRVNVAATTPLGFAASYLSTDNSGSTLAVGFMNAMSAEGLWLSAEL